MSPKIEQLTDKKLLEQLILNSQQQTDLLTEFQKRNDPTQAPFPLLKGDELTSNSHTPKNKRQSKLPTRFRKMLENQIPHNISKITQKQLIEKFIQCDTKEQLEELTFTFRKVSELYLWLLDQLKPSPDSQKINNQSNNKILRPHCTPLESLKQSLDTIEVLAAEIEEKRLLDSEASDLSE